MNVRRVAALLRELADAFEEETPPEEQPSRPRPNRARRPRALTRPEGEATPLVAAQAARILKSRGFT